MRHSFAAYALAERCYTRSGRWGFAAISCYAAQFCVTSYKAKLGSLSTEPLLIPERIGLSMYSSSSIQRGANSGTIFVCAQEVPLLTCLWIGLSISAIIAFFHSRKNHLIDGSRS